MKCSVIFTDAASFEVLQIEEWIAERSRKGAATWQAALFAAANKLSDRGPEFSLAPEADLFAEPIRQILFRTRRGLTYRALFVVRDETVIVVSVRGFGQDLVGPNDVMMPD